MIYSNNRHSYQMNIRINSTLNYLILININTPNAVVE
jgi:hypothetical protein